MGEPIGPFSLVVLAIPAIALRVAVRALYGRQGLAAAEPMQLLLLLSSTILFCLAVLGAVAGMMGFWLPFDLSPVSILASLVVLVVLAVALAFAVMMVVDRSRQAEHRALVWTLAAAAERGIALSEAARAYADEASDDTSVRSLALAEAIERGQPLSEAVRVARLRMGAAMRLAVRLGERLGVLGPAMRQQLDGSLTLDTALRDAVLRLIHLGTIVAALIGVAIFMMIRVVPVLQRLVADGGGTLPSLTQRVIDTIDYLAQSGWIAGVIYLTVVFLLGIVTFVVEVMYVIREPKKPWHDRRALRTIVLLPFIWPVLLFVWPALFYAGWFPRDLPIVWRLFRHYDGAVVMRGLALAIRRAVPLPAALALVAESYPIAIVAARLREAAEQVAQGSDWRASLRCTGLISPAQLAVLGAAQRVGNLDWAMEEMANSALRGETRRVQTLIFVLYPAALMALALIVCLFVAGFFLPVVALIHKQIPT